MKHKIWVNIIGLSSPLVFQLCLKIDTKIIAHSDVILNVSGGNI